MLSRLVVDDGVRVFSCVCALFDSSSGMDFAHSMRLLAVLCKVGFLFCLWKRVLAAVSSCSCLWHSFFASCVSVQFFLSAVRRLNSM